MNTREEILRQANEAVNGERQGAYGKPEDNFKRIAWLWSDYLRMTVTAQDVAHLMILLKVARAMGGGYHADNYVDIAGYAACAAEIAETLTIYDREG